MHPSSSPLISALLAAGLLGASLGASAQTAEPSTAAAAKPEHSLSFNLGAVSDYRYRGISQSRLDPAISAGADYSHASGLYLGTWLSSIRWIKDGGGDAPMEWDVYGGYKGSAGPLGYDVGLLRYQYPSARLAVSPNTTEIYGALTYEMVTLKYSHALTNLFGVADSKGSGYLDLSANLDLGEGWSVVPHVGRQGVRHNGALAYTDYALTLNKDFGNGLSASAAVVGTNADKALYVTPSGRFTGRTALVLGIKYSF
ncbi:TorF family putative porin [Ottowia pentelensis]|uniref:TorF family putative porin n=1 Tax=Ottowia pentelensis TaxID=511108 RepID=A0ABV6PTP8_9BURK